MTPEEAVQCLEQSGHLFYLEGGHLQREYLPDGDPPEDHLPMLTVVQENGSAIRAIVEKRSTPRSDIDSLLDYLTMSRVEGWYQIAPTSTLRDRREWTVVGPIAFRWWFRMGRRPPPALVNDLADLLTHHADELAVILQRWVTEYRETVDSIEDLPLWKRPYVMETDAHRRKRHARTVTDPCQRCRERAWWIRWDGAPICGVCHPPAPGAAVTENAHPTVPGAPGLPLDHIEDPEPRSDP